MNLTVDSKGQAFMTMNTVGSFTVTATAKDTNNNTGTATATLVVNNLAGTPPTITLTGPTVDQYGNIQITAPTAITGSVSDDHTNGVSYTVTVIPADGTPSFQIGSGSTTTSNTLTLSNVTFDPTMLANGDYTLEIRATDVDDNLTTILDKNVAVSAKLKLGRETLSVTDLSIPVAGVPLTITRTYDSLEAGHSADFGYGWRLSVGDSKLEVDLSTTFDAGWGGYPAFTASPTSSTRVFITTPDGTREGFTFTPYQTALDSFGLFTDWHPAFTPDAGINDTLTVPDAILTQDGTNSGYYIITDAGSIDYYNPADPTFGGIYTLTDLSGLASTIDANSGKLLSMKGRNNNTLTFSSSAITSNTGKTIGISRDPQGRITAITDPRNHSVNYGYDINGNLTSVTDRAGDNPTMYGYDTAHAHYLKTITDPLGVQELTATFDTTGRMTQVTDAKGNPLALAYDTTALSQTITDQNNKSATLAYDAVGNITKTVDQTGKIMLAQYDIHGNAQTPFLNKQTQVIGQIDSPQNGENNDLITSFQNDPRTGLPLTRTDPQGNTTFFTYDVNSQMVGISNFFGDTVRSTFDQMGDLSATTDPLNRTSQYKYDTHGNPTLVISPEQAKTSYSYNISGDLVNTTDSQGVTISYTYDLNDNQTGSSWTWVNPSNTSDTHTVTTTTIPNANDQLSQAITSEGTTSVVYDAAGREVQSYDIYGRATQLTYDADRLIIERRRQSPDQNGVLQWLVQRTVYDAKNQPIVETDEYQDGAAVVEGTQTTYDDAGRVMTARDYEASSSISSRTTAFPLASSATMELW